MDQTSFPPKGREALVPKVLLTTTNRWPSPSRMAIALREAGCRVWAICPRHGHPLLCTSAVEEVFSYSSIDPLESLTAAIKAVRPGIVIPSDDRGVEHLHELHARVLNLGKSGTELAKLIEFSLGSPEGYAVVSSRSHLLRVAAEEGIRIPDTQPLKNLNDLGAWALGHELPWVLKGDGTFGGKGVRIAQTRKQAEQQLQQIRELFGLARVFKRAIVNRDAFWLRPWWKGHKPALSIQSYIDGRPANCAFMCWKGEVRALISVEVVSSEGQTGPADIVRVIDNTDMSFAAERLAQRLQLSGFFGLDFMIERGTGATYLIELNPRCTPLTHLQLGDHRNLPEALAAQLAKRSERELPSITRNDLIAYYPQLIQCKSDFLPLSFHDIPKGEPALVEELRSPWPDRSLLYRVVSKLSEFTAAVKERQGAKGGLTSL